jgi:hypothetical protein
MTLYALNLLFNAFFTNIIGRNSIFSKGRRGGAAPAAGLTLAGE